MSENLGKVISLKAAQNMEGKKFAAVKVSDVRTFDLCGAGEECIGILQNEVIAGEAGRVVINGVTFAVASGVIAAGAKVAAAADGQIKTADEGASVIGVAIETAAAAGDIITIVIK